MAVEVPAGSQEGGTAHRDAPGVKTRLHDAIILPEVVGCTVGIYNGKTFNQVEIKPEMTSHSLGEFSVTYNPGTSKETQTSLEENNPLPTPSSQLA